MRCGVVEKHSGSLYRRTLEVCLSHPGKTALLLPLTLLVGVVLFTRMPKVVFPRQDIGIVSGGSRGSGSSLAQTKTRLWKYISELFDAVIAREGEDKHGYKLYVGEGNGDWSFLIWDRGEKEDLPDDRWWQPIEKLMETKKRSRTVKSE